MRSTLWPSLLLLLGLAACGEFAMKSPPAEEHAEKTTAGAPAASPALMGAVRADESDANESSPDQQPTFTSDPAAIPAMIIRTGQASLEIDSLEVAVAQVRQLADRVGGFIANSQMQAGANQLRSATLEVKVPAARFDELTRGLAPIGRVEYVNVTAEDVGEEFTDVTARVANSHRLESRLIELLATRTGKLSDVLEIERELARVREEIERMEGRLRYLKAHAATSTLSITVHEKAPLVGERGSGSEIAEAFRAAWRNFVAFVATAIAALGTLIPMAVILVAGMFGLRALWRRRHG